MAQRTRYIRPEFFTSPDTAKASFPARILYAAMWGWTDEQGVGITNLTGLLGYAFPESDGFTTADISKLLKEIGKCYGTVFYEIRGRYFFFIPTWTTHQTADARTKKRNPLPTDVDAVPDVRFHVADVITTGKLWDPAEPTGTHRQLVIGNEGLERGDGELPAVVATSEPLTDRCPKHVDDPDPPNCIPCMRARQRRDQWVRDRDTQTQDDLKARRLARDDCTRCKGTGLVDVGENSVDFCPDCSAWRRRQAAVVEEPL